MYTTIMEDNMSFDQATMSELDEINPQDSISYTTKFFESAKEFMDMVGCESTMQLKGRAFSNKLRQCFSQVQKVAGPELQEIKDDAEKLGKNINSEGLVPRSSNFDLFADELIKRCSGEDCSNLYDDPRSSYQN